MLTAKRNCDGHPALGAVIRLGQQMFPLGLSPSWAGDSGLPRSPRHQGMNPMITVAILNVAWSGFRGCPRLKKMIPGRIAG